ncbi:M24 family metallopeptidase C-terminal domain-containing protein [Phenylobacterium sp. J367]|nr:M24 family metallopeptidase C-terminal domain-containing protein [Phenylobacterium sp. J367]
MGFETLTLAPIDRRLIEPKLLTDAERAQLNAYHARVLAVVGPQVEPTVRTWLEQATAPV